MLKLVPIMFLLASCTSNIGEQRNADVVGVSNPMCVFFCESASEVADVEGDLNGSVTNGSQSQNETLTPPRLPIPAPTIEVIE